MGVADRARDDTVVAASAAAATVALAVVLQIVVGIDPGVLVQGAPLAVYFCYLFVPKGPSAVVQDPRVWAALSALVAVAAGGFVLL
ncbi:MAG: hypothetical protein ABEJ79_09410 [Halolamina sp.]